MTPCDQEIPPNETFAFSADFSPYEPDSYFFQIAQGFISLLNGASNKNKKLLAATSVSGKTSKTTKTLLGSIKQKIFEDFNHVDIDPPICMSLRLCGHSFAPGSQPFIPMIKLSQSRLQFSPCSPGESVFQTLLI